MAIGEQLKAVRELHGYSQTYIASLIGTSQQHYGKYELDKVEIPLNRLIQLADFYGVSLDYLCGREHDKEKENLRNALLMIHNMSDKQLQNLASEILTEQ